jgi:dipeptidase
MCDTIAAAGRASAFGTVLFGKNSDREYDEAQYLALIPRASHEGGVRLRLTYTEIGQVRETHALLLSKPHWIWGAEIGANEQGLVIGNEALFTKSPASSEPGIIGMDYVRLALERAGSVDEGIEVITKLLREHGQSGRCGYKRDTAYHNSFMLADTRGATVLETVDRDWAVVPVKDYYAISNAMTIAEFKTAHEDASRVASGGFRRERAMELLGERAGRLAVADFMRILRDHQEGQPAPGRPSGPRICAHTRESPLGQTTASWVASLRPGRIVHWVTGTAAPCMSVFKPVLIETGLPEHGPTPGKEEDDRSLWWRHEQLRRYLDASDDASRQFITERDRLELRLLEDMEACRSASVSPDTRETVTRCWRDAEEFETRWLERARGSGKFR